MHAALTELLDHVKVGWLWVGADGVVRHASRQASRLTDLMAGQRLTDPALLRAVRTAALGRTERRLPARMAVPGGSPVDLDCKVVPGSEGDDAFVLLQGHDEPDGAQGIDVLMRAVRRDLRDPLRAALAALGLMRQSRQQESEASMEMDALLDRVGGLLQVADQLVDLAALWQGDGVPDNDRIELWTLLQQVWSEVEPLALDRQVRVRFTTDVSSPELATMYGNERWLRQVFTDCLKGAVRLTPPGGKLEVAHVQAGPRAAIVLHDCRLFSRAEGSPHEIDAIGHQLCRHVLAMHGGRVGEQLDGERRHLVIELPTGAPHHNDEPQLAIAQAQHYARDLAALMSRQRTGQRVEAPVAQPS